MSSALLADLWPDDDDSLAQAWEETAGAHAELEPDTAYQTDLFGWAELRLGIPRRTLVWSLNPGYDSHSWDGTPDPFVAVANALYAWDDVGMESGTGTGKTFFLAVVALWFMACWRNALVLCYAPTADTLKKQLFKEIGHLFPRFARQFPQADLTTLHVRMLGGIDEAWTIAGKGTKIRAGEESTVSAQGSHAPDMLLIGDETPGMAAATITAHENTCTAPHNLRIYAGNPDNQQDALHQVCTTPGVVAVRISAYDHPNVVAQDHTLIPGAVSVKRIERRRLKYGEDHPLFQSRVRGISPEESSHALIKAKWVRAAFARGMDPKYRVGPMSIGVDVANSENGDKGAIAIGLGACLLSLDAKQVPDCNVFGREVVELARARGILAKHVGVDATGVGAGTVNEARRLDFRVIALYSGTIANAQQPTTDAKADLEVGERTVTNVEKFLTYRAQYYWQAMDDLMHGQVAIENEDQELLMDLIAPQWEIKNGKITLESKEDLRERLGRSPNKGDAFVYWNWIRPRVTIPIDPDTVEISVWDPDVLESEAERSRKLAPRMKRRRTGIRQLVDSGGY